MYMLTVYETVLSEEAYAEREKKLSFVQKILQKTNRYQVQNVVVKMFVTTS